MSLPGFTAEAALARTGKRQHHLNDRDGSMPSRGIVPQNIECDYYIVCVDGLKYLVRDCPDGSGDESVIGTCPKPRPRPWWIEFGPYIRHPWFEAWR